MHLSTDSADQPPPEAPPLPEHLVPYLLSRAFSSFNRAWTEHLREHGITIARWQVLAILSEYDGARIGQLAEMSATGQAVTSRVVDQMERDGLVRRRPVASDGRAVEVRLTARGRATFETLVPQASEVVAKALHGIDETTARILMEGLATVTTNLAGSATIPAEVHA